MANQIITFPQYLSDPAFQYRKVTIKVIRSSDKKEDVGTNFKDILAKSQKKATEFAQVVYNTTQGDYTSKDLLKKANKQIQQASKTLKGQSDVLYTFTLPLPNNFTDSHSHQWSVDKGIVGSFLSDLNDSLAGKAIAIMSDATNQRKPLADPGYFQNYSGTEPREFSLSFDLVPNNAQEAADIFNILYIMRQYALPSVALSHAVMLAPHYFQIEFSNGYINTLVGATDVVLKNISLDYGADGQMQQFPDGQPKQMKLDLVFAERSMSTNQMENL